MNTRGRKKQSGTTRVPVNPAEGPTVSTDARPEPVVKKSTRGRTKVPATQKSRVVVTPVKNAVPMKKKPIARGPKTKTAHVSDEESEGSLIEGDLELPMIETELEDESKLEIERLRKKLLELEADQGSRNPLKAKRSKLEPSRETTQRLSSPDRRGNPTDGRSLGTFNVKTDLATFLVRFKKCSRHFGWSQSDKVFHLMNALTESAEPIVKEVGPSGTLNNILELLQNRFGNKFRLETFHSELRNRRRGRHETFQDLYLDLCRRRALAKTLARSSQRDTLEISL